MGVKGPSNLQLKCVDVSNLNILELDMVKHICINTNWMTLSNTLNELLEWANVALEL